MPDLKAALTKAIADHQPDMDRPCWANERWCRGCEQSFRIWPWSEFAAHQADVLLALPGVAVTQLPDGALTEQTETIPVFIEDVPRRMVWRGSEEVPAQHAEFIPHKRLTTVWYSDECPECATEHGIHDRRQAECRASAERAAAAVLSEGETR